MAALTADRNTPSRTGERRSFPVKAATKIWAGALVCIDSSGRAVPGSTATGLIAVGRSPRVYDNSAGADGAVVGEFERGIYRFDNSTSTDAITAAEIGSTCYVVDDHTVAKTNGSSSRSAAGTVFDVDALGVWVRFA
jgi:hypothetical protein